jgi:hypothetical protein
MIRRTLAIVLSLVLVAALSACGNKQNKTLKAETEGIYLDVGDLKYQVEISRQLNPADEEDRAYLKGVSEQLGPEDVWFAVFIRVQNESGRAQRPAEDFDITDTQENEFTPVSIDARSNDFAYQPVLIADKSLLPNVNSIASQNSIGGELLLFKMPRESLDNRPLELKVHNPQDSQSFGTVNLDV